MSYKDRPIAFLMIKNYFNSFDARGDILLGFISMEDTLLEFISIATFFSDISVLLRTTEGQVTSEVRFLARGSTRFLPAPAPVVVLKFNDLRDPRIFSKNFLNIYLYFPSFKNKIFLYFLIINHYFDKQVFYLFK